MLTGTAVGANRKAVLRDAQRIAREYYGIECVRVDLRAATPESMVEHTGEDVASRVSSFSAEFEAVEWHRIEHRAYGPNVCRNCKQESWPSDPLPGVRP